MPAPDLPVAAAIRRPAWSQFYVVLAFTPASFGQKRLPVAAFDAAPARPVLHATRVPFRQARRPCAAIRSALYFVPLRLSQASGRGVARLGACGSGQQRRVSVCSGARAACRSRPNLQRQYPVAMPPNGAAVPEPRRSGYRAWTKCHSSWEGAPKLADFTAERARKMRVQQSRHLHSQRAAGARRWITMPRADGEKG